MARYALVIGIAGYDKFPNLKKAATDAEAIALLLEKHGNFQDVKRLPARWIGDESRFEVGLDKPLKGNELREGLKTFLLEQAHKQEALIYFAGHGFEVESWTDEKKGYLATSDCTSNGQNGILLDDLNKLIGKSDLSNLVVLLDCCHAGSILERKVLDDSLKAFGQKDYYLIAACRAFEKAREDIEHGVFTAAVLKGLLADNADEDGRVSGDRLFDFITSELKGSGQEPIRMGWGRSITLVQYPPKQREKVVKEDCPYQGLRYFGEKEKDFFFGREKVIQLLWQKLGEGNFVPIIGASGSGKSSVVRAGLIPKLKENGWELLAEPILPGVEPLAELKRAFNGWFERSQLPEIYSLIERGDLAAVIERLPGSKRLLLVVDQFEEVFTLRSLDKDEQIRRFIELLTKVAEIPDSRLAIVTTMRADFLEYCLSYESLTKQFNQNQAVYMPPLLGAELEEAIVKPANLQGYHLETGLLGAILDDVGKEKDCLPLLQFALTELWEARDKQRHQLTVAKYKQLGGVIGSLNTHAEKLYQNFTEQQQYWVKRICLRLVKTAGEIKDDTRQRQAKYILLALSGDTIESQQSINGTLEKLIQGRLLVTGQEAQEEVWVDLAHEALIDGWKRFSQWREEGRKLRQLNDKLEYALREWLSNEQTDDFLMMGGLLFQIRAVWSEIDHDLHPLAKEFYLKSIAREIEQRAAYKSATQVEAKSIDGKLVVLKVGEGDFNTGFPVTLQISQEGSNILLSEKIGHFPPAPEIPGHYYSWQLLYKRMGYGVRALKKRKHQVKNISIFDELKEYALVLKDSINTWLFSNRGPRRIREEIIETIAKDEEIRFLLQTDNVALWRLPWNVWDLLEIYSKVELAVSNSIHQQRIKHKSYREKVRILAIFGNNSDISLQHDYDLLRQIPDAELVSLVEPQREDMEKWLRDNQGWDILFFAGHSESEPNSETGSIYINKSERLPIDQFKDSLSIAINRGLNLAIFNSCDGLGLAKQLSYLYIPQVIVMREPVPDVVAQEFLSNFISSFAGGQSLYLSARQARERLKRIEDTFPCASWLPVIYQNAAEVPLTWQQMRGAS